MGLADGIMLAVVVFDLMKESMSEMGVPYTIIFIFIGVLLTMLLKKKLDVSKDMKTGYLIFISILLHNLPEGLAIGSSFMSAETLGMTLAIIIGIHNIPEGLAMALSLVGSKMKISKVILFTIIAGCSTAQFNLEAPIQGVGYVRKFRECFTLDRSGELSERGLITQYITSFIDDSLDSYEAPNDHVLTLDNLVKALDFTLYDQYGNTHTLSEYEGKTVFLNIWATWCPPCKQEMPYIEELYKEYNLNKEDVVILGLASPYFGKEGSKEDIKEFLNSNKYTFPVVFDENADLIYSYGIQAFPTTFVIDKEGYIAQYVPGGMTKEIMKTLIESVK